MCNNLKIENNIFNYKSDKRIKLVSIPKEILLIKNDSNELLGNNSYMFFDNIYILKQNKNLTKTSHYYYIKY